MNNEELTKKLGDLLEKFEKLEGKQTKDIEKRKENLKDLGKNCNNSCNDEDTTCGMYVTNTAVGVCGNGQELATLLASLIQYCLDKEIIDEAILNAITSTAIKMSTAKKEGNFDEVVAKEIEKFMTVIDEMLED